MREGILSGHGIRTRDTRDHHDDPVAHRLRHGGPRAYPPDDANLTKLRENLAKDNPGQETTDKIVAALTP